VFAVNAVFGLLAFFGVLPFAGAVTAVSLSGVGIAVVVLINLVSDISSMKSILGSPSGYTYALTPVRGGKILFARMLAIIIQDIIMIGISILGCVWLSISLYKLANTRYIDGEIIGDSNYEIVLETFIGGLVGVIQLIYIFVVIVFCFVIKNSLLFRIKGRSILCILCGAGVYWILSLLDFILIPFADVQRFFFVFNILIYDIRGVVIYGIIGLVKTIILFLITANLFERRYNF
jgi:hypothetical protein